MNMQWRDRELAGEYKSRSEELERQRIEALERGDPSPDPDMTGVPVEPAEPASETRLGAAVVGGALGAVAGALVGGPAGAIVGGAVGAAGGAVVASGNGQPDVVYDIDRRDLSGEIRRPRDDDLESGY